MTKTIRSLITVSLLSAGAHLANAAVISGSVTDFTSPDQLLLDPATSVVAVDFGANPAGGLVNGVTFLQNSGTAGGATVANTFANAIDNWGTPIPAFTGADPTSVTNFNSIMHDIRWDTGASNPTINVTGLTDGTIYNVQLLFTENGANDRHFDIGVDGALVVDDFFTPGTSNTVGRVYSGNFDPGAGGTSGALNIIFGADPIPSDPNNTAATGLDNNPIIQAIIIHEVVVVPEPSSLLLSFFGFFLLSRRKR